GDQSYFEIILKVVDSSGKTGTSSVSIQPQTVNFSINTSPTGLQVVYGGEAGTAPMTRTTIAGSTHTIYTPSPQGSLVLGSWSDGGAQQHNVVVGAADVTFTATFTNGQSQGVGSKIGIFRGGVWYFDVNGNFAWNGTAGGDRFFGFGVSGDIPITGDWNGSG